MRGSPLIRALVAFLLIAAFAPVIVAMTRAVQKPAAPAVNSASQPTGGVELAFAFTTLPKKITILHLGKPVWTKESPAEDEEVSLQIPWPKQGGELHFQVEWPDTLSAMRARLTTPGGAEIERTLWGRGSVEDVLNFP